MAENVPRSFTKEFEFKVAQFFYDHDKIATKHFKVDRKQENK